MVLEKVIAILADYNGADASTIKPETTFAELSLDSLDVAELVMSLEDEFGVTIEMNENLKTVGDITKYIEEKLAEWQATDCASWSELNTRSFRAAWLG